MICRFQGSHRFELGIAAAQHNEADHLLIGYGKAWGFRHFQKQSFSFAEILQLQT